MSGDIGEEFRESLRCLRRERGMTMRELAKASGVALSTICRFENGWGSPHLTTAVMLARALGVTVDGMVSRDLTGRPAGSGASSSERTDRDKGDMTGTCPGGNASGSKQP